MFSLGRGRFRILQLIILVAGLALAGRVIQIQVFQHQERGARWRSPPGATISAIAPERGNIYDSAMRPLALSVSSWRVGIATSLLEEDAGRGGGSAGPGAGPETP